MGVVVIVCVGVGGGRRVDEQFAERQLAVGFVEFRNVVQECRIHPSADGTDDLNVRIAFAHPRLDALDGGVAVVFGELVQLVDDHQGRRAVAGGREATAVDGVEVGGGIDDVDDTARPHSLDPAVPDDPSQGDGFGEPTGLDDDGVQAEPRVGELLQRRVESALVGQAADAAACDRRRLVDLARHQGGIDVEFAKVVDDHANPGSGRAQDVVQQTGLACAEVAGQRDDGDR